MPGLSDLIGRNGILEQLLLWGVLNQVIGSLGQPGLTALQQDVQAKHPELALDPVTAADLLARELLPAADAEAEAAKGGVDSERFARLAQLHKVRLQPADLATAVLRNFMDRDQAAELAGQQGVDAATFDVMTHLAGDAPGPDELAIALRRGLIPEGGTGPDSTSFLQGIAEGRLADKWAPVIAGLAKLWPTPVDAIDALVKGQIPAAEGKALYERLGGDPDFYTWLLHSAGEGPSPLEAAAAAYRGLIPWQGVGPEKTTYDQAVHESRYRDKWQDFYRRLGEYFPSPSEAITFAAHRAIDQAEAVRIFKARGISDQWVPAFVNEINLTDLSEYRGLTQSAIVDMYYARLIDRATAVDLLATVHVTDTAAGMLLDYADLRQVLDAQERSVQRIAQLYTGRKISTETAREALARLKIPSTSVEAILATWELQAQATVTTLTAAQIADAWKYKVFTLAEATEELQAIGYTDYDAWAYLSVTNKAPLPDKPVRNVARPPGHVIPGVT